MPRDPGGGEKDADRVAGPQGEIYVEYKQVGQAMKVTAIDAASGLEVVIMGPLSAAQSQLQQVAVQKLLAQLKKARSSDDEGGPQDGSGSGSKGWIA